MQVSNKELIKAIVKNLSTEYELNEAYNLKQLSRNELISKLIITETTIKILEEKIKVLEWENHVWNSSDSLRVPKFSF